LQGLLQRVRLHEQPQRSDGLLVPPQIQQQGGVAFGAGQPQLGQAQALGGGVRAGHAGQRLALPQPHGRLQGRQLGEAVAGGPVPPALLAQRLEAEHVHVLLADVQAVGAAAGGEQLPGGPAVASRLEHLAQRRDVRVDVADRARGWLLTPQGGDELLAGDRVTGVQSQHGQHRGTARRAQRELCLVPPRAYGSQQAKVQTFVLCRHGCPTSSSWDRCQQVVS
jgi:hypothetical protein